MSYNWCLKKLVYVARLSTFVVLLKRASNISDQEDVYTVLKRSYDVPTHVENLCCL